MTTNEAREELMESVWRSEEHIDAIRAMDEITLPSLEKSLRGYVAEHLLIDEDKAACYTIDELVDMSMERCGEVQPELMAELEDAKGFSQGKDADFGRAALFASIEAKLGLRLDESRAKDASRFSQLVTLVWRAMESSPVWSPRLMRVPERPFCSYTAFARVLA